MEEAMMRVDGNAMGGTLVEIFVHEMAAARIACGRCGSVEPIGAQHAYMRAPGIVLRCCHCEDVLLVVTRAAGRYVLAFRGMRWLEVADEE